MKRVLLITGVGGFVGQHALDFAVDNPFYDKVIATDIVKPSFGYSVPDEFYRADLTDRPSVGALLANIRSSMNRCSETGNARLYIWHIGGLFDYKAPRGALYDVNVGGTVNLVRVFQNLNLHRFVFWSGGVVYGDFDHPDHELPADENYPAYPTNDYGWSKRQAEDRLMHFHESHGLPVAIMRLAGIYGPGAEYGMGKALRLNLEGKLPNSVVGDGVKTPSLVHVEDVIRVADFLSRVSEASGEIFNVVAPVKRTIRELSKAMGEETDNPLLPGETPIPVFEYLVSLVSKRAKQLGGEPIVDEGLAEMTTINAWMDGSKLQDLMRRYERCDLFKYSDSVDGIRETIRDYRERHNV